MPKKLGRESILLGIDLERLFRTPGQISVLRVLWKAPAPLTGRRVQQLAGVHNLTATQSLEDLENLGLVQRRSAGRAYLYALKRSHRLVRYWVAPIFKAEENAPGRFTRDLWKALDGQCLSAMVYGSVARAESDRAGDVDLLVVVRDEKAAKGFELNTQPKVEKLIREGWSMMLEVNLKTVGQLAKHWRSPLIRKIRQEGRWVAGAPLEEVKRAARA